MWSTEQPSELRKISVWLLISCRWRGLGAERLSEYFKGLNRYSTVLNIVSVIKDW